MFCSRIKVYYLLWCARTILSETHSRSAWFHLLKLKKITDKSVFINKERDVTIIFWLPVRDVVIKFEAKPGKNTTNKRIKG